jgi:hypothetical protein
MASRARRDPGGNARCGMPSSVASGCLRYGGGAGTGVLGEHAGWAGRSRTMSRELALVSGRPCDLPGCAASANP